MYSATHDRHDNVGAIWSDTIAFSSEGAVSCTYIQCTHRRWKQYRATAVLFILLLQPACTYNTVFDPFMYFFFIIFYFYVTGVVIIFVTSALTTTGAFRSFIVGRRVYSDLVYLQDVLRSIIYRTRVRIYEVHVSYSRPIVLLLYILSTHGTMISGGATEGLHRLPSAVPLPPVCECCCAICTQLWKVCACCLLFCFCLLAALVLRETGHGGDFFFFFCTENGGVCVYAVFFLFFLLHFVPATRTVRAVLY